MNCTISPQNALIIDRLLKTIKTSMMSIDTTSKILFQLVSSDKTLVLDFNLEESFFNDLQLKKKLITIPKQKFYMKKMKSLRIIYAEYMLTFEYLFDEHIFRRNVFYISPSLFSMEFSPNYSGEINPNSLTEILKEIYGQSITFKISNNTGEILTKGMNVKFPLKFNGEFSVSSISNNLKNIFSVSDLFLQTIINYESSNSPLNFIFIGTEIKALFFTAVNEI